MKKRVFVDAYLYNNLGDDLFVDVLTQRYPETDFVCISRFYRPVTGNILTVSKRLAEKMLGMNALRKKEISRSDLIVSIGGSMYIESESKDNCIYDAEKDLYILGANFGPWKTQEYVEKFRKAFSRAKDVSFRDSASEKLFEELPAVRYSPDILFSLPVPRVSQKKQVFISVMKASAEHSEANALIRKQAQAFHEQGYEIVLGSFCDLQGDTEACRKVASQLPFETRIIVYDGDRQKILEEMAASEKIIASRFHALVLGLRMGKEVLPVSYSVKTDRLLEDLGLKGAGIRLQDSSSNEESPLWISLDSGKMESLSKGAEGHFKKLDEVLR